MTDRDKRREENDQRIEVRAGTIRDLLSYLRIVKKNFIAENLMESARYTEDRILRLEYILTKNGIDPND